MGTHDNVEEILRRLREEKISDVEEEQKSEATEGEKEEEHEETPPEDPTNTPTGCGFSSVFQRLEQKRLERIESILSEDEFYDAVETQQAST